MKTDFNHIQTVTKLITSLILVLLLLVMVVGVVVGILYVKPTLLYTLAQPQDQSVSTNQLETAVAFWQEPDVNGIEKNESGDEIRYGRELIVNTSTYLGPRGKVLHMSNGMNCQNCHLDAGTKIFGNNYSAVASTYPKFRARSGEQESIEKRVNDCFERSLNGSALPEDGKEMKAIVAYIKWLGKAVPKGETPAGAGLVELPYLDRAADPVKGKVLYEQQCTVCHGATGQGVLNQSGNAFTYPPLWGKQSYNSGAGLYRLSRFAGYIKANMPLGATHTSPLLSDEEAWDIAAYVNAMDRPGRDISKDWPEIAKKPIDHPFGPFADDFSEQQHKFGPYKAIADRRIELAAMDKIKK
jgi:thiosulfate dehydrogenase